MEKIIILKNSKVTMKCDENFLKMFRGFAYKTFILYSKVDYINDDERHELDITIFEAFKKYNYEFGVEFSTYLVWSIRGYVSKNISYNKAIKRDYSNISLEINLNSDERNKSIKISDTIIDYNINIEEQVEDKEFIEYITKKLNKFENRLLDMNLKKIKMIDLVKETGKSKANINNYNVRFKKKLLRIISEFNKEIIS